VAPSFAPVLARAECSFDSVRDSAGARCCAASRGSGAERVRRKTGDRGAPAPVTACSTVSCASDHASMPMTGTAARTRPACGPPRATLPTRSRIGLPRLAGTLREAQPGKGRPVRSAAERSRACHQVSLSCACRTAVPERSSSPRNLTTVTSSWSRADSRGSGIRPHPACAASRQHAYVHSPVMPSGAAPHVSRLIAGRQRGPLADRCRYGPHLAHLK
jgi:hypothetical protein